MRIFFVILSITVLLSSCGYSSYNECLVKETQKNNGIKSGWITNYCKEQFRAKEKSKPPVIPEKKGWKLAPSNFYEITKEEWEERYSRKMLYRYFTNKSDFKFKGYRKYQYAPTDGMCVFPPNKKLKDLPFREWSIDLGQTEDFPLYDVDEKMNVCVNFFFYY